MRIDLDSIGIEFTFDTKIRTNRGRTKFYKDLYGYTLKTHHKKYTYSKPGILSGIKHLRPTKSTIIVSLENAPKLQEFFKQNKVKFTKHAIVLNQQEAKALGLSHPTGWHALYEEVLGNPNTRFSVDF